MRFVIGKDVLPHEYKGAIYNQESATRLKWIKIIFSVLFVIFILRTLQLGMQSSDIGKNGVKASEIASRADIVDRNGVVLAKSIRSGNIKLYPKKVKEEQVNEIAQIINEIAPMDYSIEDALRVIRSGRSGVYIKKNATEEQIKKIDLLRRKYNCLDTEPFTYRQYPQRNVFAHVVGFAGKDKGSEGMEYMYDEYLRENKDPLRLSIDSRVQNIFHEQLSIAMNKFHAKGAMGMMMNSSTGEMIAMVQIPDFDPNNINNSPESVRRFKLMRDNFEMGSIFKIFNTALAYENNLQNKDYEIDKPFMILDKFGRPAMKKPIDDVSSFKRDVVKKAGHKTLKAPEIMLHSCNVGSAKIALDLRDGVQQEFFHRLQFDKALQLEFGKTESPLIHKHWGPVEHATAAFGHGVSVTPMHLLLAVNAMTNGGIYIYPTLLKRNIGAVRGERILSADISEKLRDIMFRIVEKTSGKKAQVKGIDIGGKTGTAEKRNADGTADKKRNATVFMGIFPVSAPQYIIFIMLDEPQATLETGGWRTASLNAVPTAGAILDGIIPLLFE